MITPSAYLLILLNFSFYVCIRPALDSSEGIWSLSSEKFRYDNCGEGEWMTITSSNDNLYHLYGSRIQQRPDGNITDDLLRYFQEACPAESILRSCYFHKDKDFSKLQSLEKRIFIPNNPWCKQFQPLEFLEILRNRRVIMMGDSIMNQIFSSLVCALYRITSASYGIDFRKLWKGQCNEINCPFNQPKHSHSLGGWINFPIVNTSIIQITTSFYNSYKEFDTILQNYHPLSSNDIIIYNIGIHYYNITEYSNIIHLFIHDMETYYFNITYRYHQYKQQHKDDEQPHGDESDSEESQESPDSIIGNSRIPLLFFLDTSPQHFNTELNGYYKQETKDYPNNYCDKTLDIQMKYKNDWRNRIIEKHLQNIYSKLFYIPMSTALYSQYDAHVGIQPLPYAPIDCTHWCYPSNIFKYMHMMIYNAFRKHVPPLPMTSSMLEKTMLPPRIKNGMVIKVAESHTIYLVDHGKLREFNNWDAFTKRGYIMSNVKTFPAFELESLPIGESLE